VTDDRIKRLAREALNTVIEDLSKRIDDKKTLEGKTAAVGTAIRLHTEIRILQQLVTDYRKARDLV
jgi:hypothetical protein